MKKTKKILSVLLTCALLLGALSMNVVAAGTQSNPIDANAKWFGYGVDCYLLNTTLTAGDADGVWYKLIVGEEEGGILQLENGNDSNAPVDYQINVAVNGLEYHAYENGVYNMPIITLPLNPGDEVMIQVIAQDTAQSGTVYLNGKYITGENNMNQNVKLKSGNMKVWIAAKTTVYFQDDSLQAEYATRGLLLSGSNTGESAVISGNQEYTDTDGDGLVELKLGGSLGSAGAPAVKPSFAIRNDSDAAAWYVLGLADTAHECIYTDENDADCNSCGAMRDIGGSNGCSHEYRYPCDTTCMLCGEPITPSAPHQMTYTPATDATCTQDGNLAHYACELCGGCWDNEQGTGIPLNKKKIVISATGHAYDHDFDEACGNCGEIRHTLNVLTVMGNSVSSDVNGLAIRVDANVDGMQMDGNTAVYDAATVNGFKLVGMGALVSNNGTVPTLADVDNNRVLNIPAVYLKSVDADTGLTAYTIRIINIPEEQKDTVITFQTYFVYEDAVGQQYTVYGEVLATSYNQVG